MWKTISALAAAAMITGALGLVHGSNASPSAAPSGKADRADLQENCTQHGWPYYETPCMRDESRNAGRVLTVRLISTDRIAQRDPNTRADLAPHWPTALVELQVATPVWARGTK
jgi:hypothetical protein